MLAEAHVDSRIDAETRAANSCAHPIAGRKRAAADARARVPSPRRSRARAPSEPSPAWGEGATPTRDGLRGVSRSIAAAAIAATGIVATAATSHTRRARDGARSVAGDARRGSASGAGAGVHRGEHALDEPREAPRLLRRACEAPQQGELPLGQRIFAARSSRSRSSSGTKRLARGPARLQVVPAVAALALSFPSAKVALEHGAELATRGDETILDGAEWSVGKLRNLFDRVAECVMEDESSPSLGRKSLEERFETERFSAAPSPQAGRFGVSQRSSKPRRLRSRRPERSVVRTVIRSAQRSRLVATRKLPAEFRMAISASCARRPRRHAPCTEVQ